MSSKKDTSLPVEPLRSAEESTEDILRRQNAELERLVAELREANREIAAGRRAALNMIEDAMLLSAALKEREEQQAFLLKLGDALHSLTRVPDIQDTAARMLEEYLPVAQALYSESGPGDQRGESIVVRDVATDPAISDDIRQRFLQAGVRAFIRVELVRQGYHVAGFEVHSAAPRVWTAAEVTLVRKVGDRTWEAVTRARAIEEQQIAHARTKEILESIGDIFYALDENYVLTYVNNKAEQAWGRSREQLIGRNFWEAFPEAAGSESEAMHRLAMECRETAHYETISPILGKWIAVSIFPAENGGLSVYVHDISDHKAAEDALRTSETRARTLADAIPHILWANDVKGSAVYFNKRWFEYSGLSPEASVGKGWQVIVHPDDAACAIGRWKTALNTGQAFDIEYRLRRYDNQYRWFIGRNVPVHDEQGRITGWFGSATDIQDMREATEALRESEERLRVTMENATDYAIVTIDTDNRITGWSAGAERIFGYTEAEAKGQSGVIIFTPEDQAAGVPEQEIQTAISEGRAPDERWHMRRDGSRFFLSGVMRPIFNPNLSGFVKVARDLTEQRQAEERLLLWEERYRIALQSAEMGAWDWYAGEDHLVWNDQQYYLLGLQPEYTHRNIDFFLRFVHDDDVPGVVKALEAAVAEGRAFDEEFRIMQANTNELRWMYSFGRPIEFDKNGSASRIIGVMYDITQRKRIEQQKDEFIGIASHELKTPLTSIKAYAEVLETIFREQGNKQSAGLMQRMDRQIDRLTELIHTLLDVTRISQGRLQLKKEEFDIKALAAETIEEMQRITKHYLMLEAEAVPPIYADRDRIRQVITNLLSNAIKYSPEAERVAMTIHPEDEHSIRVSVQDFGIGMTTDVADKVFERFYRAGDALSHTYPGLGLGLYISAQIVRQHGGKIWVSSQPRSGSIFCFTLPLK
jgi:PAS domain S-box-containing protein